jgi:hypothetical protein
MPSENQQLLLTRAEFEVNFFSDDTLTIYAHEIQNFRAFELTDLMILISLRLLYESMFCMSYS